MKRYLHDPVSKVQTILAAERPVHGMVMTPLAVVAPVKVQPASAAGQVPT